MALITGTHADIEAFERKYGHPADPLPLSIRQAYVDAGRGIPELRTMLSIHTPPLPGQRAGVGGCCYDPSGSPGQYGHCHVCGAHTGLTDARAACAVAGFEETPSPRSGEFLRLLVTHCPEHAPRTHDACRRDEVTPGSGGILGGPGGFCEPLDLPMTVGISFFPGAAYLGQFLKYGLRASGLALLMFGALQHSEGQMKSTLKGDTGAMGAQGDSTSGHGYNAGDVLILSGGAPSDGDQAQTGTVLIDWVVPNPAFGAPSSALPSVLTMNAVTNVAASNSGTAGHGRMVTNAATGVPTPEDGTLSTTQRRVQFSVGTSGTDLVMNTTIVVVAGTASLTSLSYTHPA